MLVKSHQKTANIFSQKQQLKCYRSLHPPRRAHLLPPSMSSRAFSQPTRQTRAGDKTSLHHAGGAAMGEDLGSDGKVRFIVLGLITPTLDPFRTAQCYRP